MIRATIYKNDRHEYAGFDISGHAEYSDPGSDVVCAAVSAIVINAINSVERFTDVGTSTVSDEESGKIEFRLKERPSHDASLLLDSMVLGLEQIEDSSEYEPYIDIIFKEV
ncbi:MAG TPA: ribosomal-processing cysteine protease Prp [Candidatus Mediterraneibacter pullistercoris]|nr:ribosomal-processing cysteine protease Prp [Candidatus Mediterraneibacter pullistercoris]